MLTQIRTRGFSFATTQPVASSPVLVDRTPASEPALPHCTALALRVDVANATALLSAAIERFNRQSAVDDEQRPPTALHPVYQELRRVTVRLRQKDAETLELCLGVSWYTQFRRQPWFVTLARMHVHGQNHRAAAEHEAKSRLHLVREAPMFTALRTTSTLLRGSVVLAVIAILGAPVVHTWPFWSASVALAALVLGTFFPAYWKMAVRSHALPELDALVAQTLREQRHRPDLPEPYRDRNESGW